MASSDLDPEGVLCYSCENDITDIAERCRTVGGRLLCPSCYKPDRSASKKRATEAEGGGPHAALAEDLFQLLVDRADAIKQLQINLARITKEKNRYEASFEESSKQRDDMYGLLQLAIEEIHAIGEKEGSTRAQFSGQEIKCKLDRLMTPVL